MNAERSPAPPPRPPSSTGCSTSSVARPQRMRGATFFAIFRICMLDCPSLCSRISFLAFSAYCMLDCLPRTAEPGAIAPSASHGYARRLPAVGFSILHAGLPVNDSACWTARSVSETRESQSLHLKRVEATPAVHPHAACWTAREEMQYSRPVP